MSAKAHLDHPGDVTWFAGCEPLSALTPCGHASCGHTDRRVIAWGPDERRYELGECSVCGCRAWMDGRSVVTSEWLGQ